MAKRLEYKMTKLCNFLKNYEVGKDEPFTHTSLGKDTPAGKYYIPKSQLNTLFKLYFEHAIIQTKDTYLTERHPNNFSIMCIDIDLRYKSKEISERNYTAEDIEEIIRVYNNAIFRLAPKMEEERLITYVFEKKNGTVDKESGVFKDGIHLMYPYIPISYHAQYRIREYVIEDLKKKNIFKNCSNTVDLIIDKCVIEKNNWIMYGSKKMNGIPYKITKVYDNNLEQMELPEINIDFLKSISILNQSEEIETEIGKMKDNEKRIRKKEKIDSVLKNSSIGKKKEIKEEFVVETLKLLSSARYNEYEDWFLVGAALYNTNINYLDMWKEWSSQSSKYSEYHCDNLWENTYPNYNQDRRVTFGSIRKMAREDNEGEYLKIVDQYDEKDSFYSLMRDGLSNTHSDFAKLIHHLYEGEFVFSDNEWFVFENNKWKKIRDNPIQLKKKITNEVIKHYLAYSLHLTNKAYIASTNDNEKERDLFNRLGEECHKVVRSLKSAVNKNNIVNECKEIFYNEEFKDELDTNIYLLGFENGVYDLKKNIFRSANPEDKISFSTGYDYTSKVDLNVRQQIMTALEKIQPNKQILDFVLTYFSSTLIGTNKNELFINLEGSGGNGKGLISTLHDCALGDYAGILNNNYLVNTFNSPESHNTMLANNYKKRFLQVNEPANTKHLNINLIKELTGCDKLQLRVAHSSDTKTVEPLFKLCMLFNELPKIENTKDGGFLRRFVGINFPNKFVDREPKKLNEHRQDPNLKQTIKNNKEWHQQYMLILLEYLRKYQENNEILEIPEEIKKNSKKLLNAQDPFEDFIDNRLIISNNETDIVRRTELWDEFRRYYRENYPDKLKINSTEFVEKIKRSVGDEIRFKKTHTMQLDHGKKVITNVFIGMKFSEDEEMGCRMNSEYDF